jgi:NAD-dependent deacetylase
MSQQEPLFPIQPKLIETLRSALHMVVLTGAGVSAESNIPTFREAQTGLWAQYSPEELATPQAFRRNPKLVWEWYAWRRDRVSQAEPNAGHLALAQLEQLKSHFTLITQNVDGLHQRAGSRSVVELHGNINRTICSSDLQVVEAWSDTDEVPPRCPECGNFLRPDVVWFGESLPARTLQAAFEATQVCDLFLSIGTSGLVQPAASLPFVALEQGAVTVEINPDTTPLTAQASYSIRAPAGQVLPALVEAIGI